MAEKRIEDAFNAFFTGDSLRNALDFAEYIKANGMTYDGEYEIHYNGKLACYINTPSDESQMWSIWTVGDYSKAYEEYPIDERAKAIAWANVVHCGNCDGTDCDPGKTETIFGKEFANVCRGADSIAMRFINPDAEALECAKIMVGMRKFLLDGVRDTAVRRA